MIATPEKISASPDKISSTKVLIVEDENYNRQLFGKYLEAEGFDPIVAENGSIGLELARQQKPEVIICKLIMSELDGYDVLNTLRQSPETATIPFVILAEQWEKNSFRYAMELGADDYLVKPCGTHELTQAVLSQLKKRSILQQGYAIKFGKTPTSTVLKDIRSSENLDSEEGSSTFPFEESLNRVFDFIEANYWRSITLAEVAEDAGYSPAYLTSQVGSLTGKTVNRWIIERRMRAAKWYLKESNYTIEQIAHRIGYQSSCHFSRQFRKYHGVAPQIWRNQQKSMDCTSCSDTQDSTVIADNGTLTHLSPKYYQKLKDYAKQRKLSESNVLARIVKDFFDEDTQNGKD
ncbi:MAG: DNA-binding response regulator [Cyanobacteria bacterium J06592_8]